MGEEKLKINDISVITGVPEARIRKIVDENPDKFRYREINKVRVFNKSAVNMVLKLDKSDNTINLSTKSTEKPIPDLPSRTKPSATSPKKPAPVPLDVYTDMKGLQDNAAKQTRIIQSLRREISEKEQQIERIHEDFFGEISAIHRLLESQQAQLDSISQWIDYFEALTDEMGLSVTERFMRGWRGNKKNE